MNIASTTFFTDQNENSLFKATWVPNRTSEGSVIDSDTRLLPIRQRRETMEAAMAEALTTNQTYPFEQGRAMRDALGWSNGLKELLNSEIDILKFVYASPATRYLLPELVAISDSRDAPDLWLDRKFPIYRTLDQVDQRPVNRVSEMSLAILYQGVESFPRLANEIENRLLGTGIKIRKLNGSQFADKRSGTARLVDEVFHKYRAVLFLGHYHRPLGGPGGWQLTSKDEEFLSFPELSDFLTTGYIPELVFSGCCCGAWNEPDNFNRDGFFYPRLFLEAGVRFFVGSWMDIQGRQEDMHNIHQMIGEFFAGWAEDPNNAVQHLHAAKRACEFHLLTSLFQMYARDEPILQGRSPEQIYTPQPSGALIQGLLPQDLVGDYRLLTELWTDPYAKTFWAQKDEGNYLVQVLVDEWQDSLEISEGLDAAIPKLAEAGLSEQHLLPNQHELVLWRRGDQEFRRLHILIYGRPGDESLAQWSTLPSRHFDPNSSTHFNDVLAFAVQLSQLIAGLHEKQLPHGNLDQTSIVFLEKQGEKHLILKDAWLRQVCPGRTTDPRYAAPEEPTQPESHQRLKYDCWGLGVILFELATGQPFGIVSPDDNKPAVSIRKVYSGGQQVPEALERVVQQCLLPSSSVCPSADLVARRLRLAYRAGGMYISEMEETLHLYIQAGYRIFALITDSMYDSNRLRKALKAKEPLNELETMLYGLMHHKREELSYTLWEAAENVGLWNLSKDEPIQPWVFRDQPTPKLVEFAGQYGLSPGALTDNDIADFNAGEILNWIVTDRYQTSETPIVLIRGSDWWKLFWQTRTARWRVLKYCQQERQRPVFLIIDNFFQIDEDMPQTFMVIRFPPLPPSDLVEKILSVPQTDHLNISEVTAETAIELAERMYPATRQEVTDALRMCALQYEVIDERAADIHDQVRRLEFLRYHTATYTPWAKLPSLERVGLPAALSEEIVRWLRARAEARQTPQRIMLSGSSGCGKTLLAQALAHTIRLPLVRIEVSRCLHAGQGQSERALREVLTATHTLVGAVVLIDDVEHFFAEPIGNDRANSLSATMARMGSLVLQWLDALPTQIVAILTSKRPDTLSPQWQRRIELHWRLVIEPTPPDNPGLGIDQTDPLSLSYRKAVVTALFRRFNLSDLTGNYALMQKVADGTHPTLRSQPLLSPTARRCQGTSLGEQRTRLKTAAEIESWMAETIYLHATTPEAPLKDDFWYAAIA